MLKSLSPTQFLQDKLVSILSKFLKDFSQTNISQLNLGLNSTLEMENLEVREDLLLKQSLPFVISEGKIGKITINIPVMFKNTPIKIEIENISIHIRPLVEQRSYESKQKKIQRFEKDNDNQDKPFEIKSYKERMLAKWDKKIKKYFQELSSGSGFANKMVDNIIANMAISVKNITIYYENYSVLNIPTFVKITLRELNIQSTDEKWVPKFNSSPTTQHRSIEIKGLAISLNMNNYNQQTQNTLYKPSLHQKSQTNVSYYTEERNMTHHKNEKGRYFLDEAEALEAEYRKLRDRETFILLPIHLTVRMTKQIELPKKGFGVESSQFFWIESVGPVILMLNKNHMRYLGGLSEHIRLISVVQKNIHLRPINPPKEKPSAWLVYACKAVIEERKRQTKFARSSSNVIKMRKYINLYKRHQTLIRASWLLRLNENEIKVLKVLEDQIPVQSLIQFRELALLEIKTESKRMNSLGTPNDELRNEGLYDEVEEMTPDEINQMLSNNKLGDPFANKNLDKAHANDIKMHIDIDFKSFYLLVTEPKENSTTLSLDLQRHNISLVQKWFDADYSVGGSKNRPIITSLTSIQELTPQHRRSTIRTEIQIQEEESEEGSFVTMQEDTFREINGTEEGSEESMLRFHDIIIDEEPKDLFKLTMEKKNSGSSNKNQDVLEKRLSSKAYEKDHSHHNLVDSWNQNLILIIEITKVSGLFNKQRDGKMFTKRALEFQNLMISTAMNLPNAVEERDQSSSPANESCFRYESLFQWILAFNFAAVMHKEEDHPLITFLKNSNCQNFAYFFETFIRDHYERGGFRIASLDAYIPFFDKQSTLHVDFPSKITEKFHSCLLNRTRKEEVILEAFEALQEHISKDILPSFIYTYGVMIFPVILQLQSAPRELLTDIASTEISEQHAKGFVDRLKGFYFKPKHSVMLKFIPREKPLPPVGTVKSQKPIFSLSLKLVDTEVSSDDIKADMSVNLKAAKEHMESQESSIEDKKAVSKMKQLSIELTTRPISIYLSPECFRSLVIFAKSFSVKKPKKMSKQKINQDRELFDKTKAKQPKKYTPLELIDLQSISYKEYNNLMDCLAHDRNYKIEKRFEKDPEINANFEEISIKIFNFGSHYIGERRLIFNLKEISFRVQKPTDTELPLPEDVKRLQNSYKSTLFRVDSIEVYEFHGHRTSFRHIPILNTKITVFIYDCVYRNHMYYDDRKMHVLIPYFKINIDDDMALFCEIIKSFTKSAPSDTVGMHHWHFPEHNIFAEISDNDKITLCDRLEALQKEHKPDKKNCNHCVVLYKKSQSIMNVFIGNLADHYQGIESSPFANLYLLEKDIETEDQDAGLQITFKHSLTSNGHGAGSKKSALLHFDLFTITRDLGFFRDNVVVHCTEAGRANFDQNCSFHHLEDDRVIFSKFQPVLKVRRDFGTYLDDNFWSYFLNLEERFHTKDPMGYHSGSPERFSAKMSKKSGIFRDKAEEESPIYALFLRKKNKRKSLLKYLEIDGFRKRFRNFMALWIKEINIDFYELSIFHNLISTFDTLAFINKWVEQFMINRNDIRPAGQQTDPKAPPTPGMGGMTFQVLKRKLDIHKVSILIDKVSYVININAPQVAWKLELDQLWIDNIDEKYGPIMVLDDTNQDKATRTLFFVKNIKFQASQQSGALIENIALKLNEEQSLLTFSIDKFNMKSLATNNQLIVEFPAMKDPRKALNTQLKFSQESLLSEIDVILSPLSLNFDKEDVVQELSVSAMLNEKLSYERGEIPRVLSTYVFEKNVFEKVQHDLAKRIKEKSAGSKQKKSSTQTKFGPFKSEETFQLRLLAENIQLNCIKDQVKFISLSIIKLESKMGLKKDFRVLIKKISLIPYDSYYEDFFADLSPEQKMHIELYKEDGSIVFDARNCKVVYMNRVLKEFKKFKKEITLEIKKLQSALITNAELYERPLEKEKKDEVEKPNKNILKVRVRDGIVVVPRSTNSKDALVIIGNVVEVLVALENHTLEMPTELKPEFTILNRNQILRDVDTFQQVRASLYVAKVMLSEAKAYYAIEDRRIYLGNAENANIMAFSPNKQITKDSWIFEAQIFAELGQFLLTLNMASIDELKHLVLENLKEQSKLFLLKTDNFENVQLNLVGKKLSFSINRSNIPATRVEELKKQQARASELRVQTGGGFSEFRRNASEQIPSKANDDNKGFEEHLDDIVGEMLALRKN